MVSDNKQLIFTNQHKYKHKLDNGNCHCRVCYSCRPHSASALRSPPSLLPNRCPCCYSVVGSHRSHCCCTSTLCQPWSQGPTPLLHTHPSTDKSTTRQALVAYPHWGSIVDGTFLCKKRYSDSCLSQNGPWRGLGTFPRRTRAIQRLTRTTRRILGGQGGHGIQEE